MDDRELIALLRRELKLAVDLGNIARKYLSRSVVTNEDAEAYLREVIAADAASFNAMMAHNVVYAEIDEDAQAYVDASLSASRSGKRDRLLPSTIPAPPDPGRPLLAHDMPAPRLLSASEMEAATEEARDLRARLDKATSGME